MDSWEYRTLQFDIKGIMGGKLDIDDFNFELNNLGSQGWELVSCFDTNMSQGGSRYVIAVLKRRVG